MAQLLGDELLVAGHIGGEEGDKLIAMHGMIGPKEGVAGVGVEEHETAEVLVIQQGEGGNKDDQQQGTQQAAEQDRLKGGPPTGLPGARPPQPEEDEGHKGQEDLAQEHGEGQGQAEEEEAPHPRPLSPRERGAREERQGAIERPEDGGDVKGLGHQAASVVEEVGVESDPGGSEQGGRKLEAPEAQGSTREEALRQAVGQPGHEQPGEEGLEQAGGEGMDAKNGVDAQQVEGVEIGPVGGGLTSRGDRPPLVRHGEAVPIQEAGGQGVVRDLIEGAGQDLHLVAEGQGHAQAQEGGEDEDKEEGLTAQPGGSRWLDWCVGQRLHRCNGLRSAGGRRRLNRQLAKYQDSHPSIWRITRAGLPATNDFSGTLEVTTLPAAITELSPMITPLRMIERAPIQTRLPICTGAVRGLGIPSVII